MRQPTQNILPTLLFALLLLSGCGDDGDPSAASETPSATVTLNVTAEGFGTADARSSNSFRVRIMGPDGDTLRVITGAFSEDPNRVFGPYQIPMPVESVSGARVEFEIAWGVEDDRLVIWSAVAPEVTLSAGSDTTLEMTGFRGPLVQQGLSSIEISGLPAEIGVGETFGATAGGEPSGALVAPSWGSLDPTLASVDAEGSVTGLSQGTARIVVAAGPVADTVEVLVRPLIEQIELSHDALSFVSLGSTATVHATVLNFRGEPMPDEPVHWSVSPAGVATVSQSGLVRAIANGAATLSASAGDASASLPVGVSQVPVVLVIRPPFATLVPGEQIGFTGRVEDAGGSPIEGFTFEWSSSETDVMTVDTDGRVTAGRVGEAVLSLRADTLEATAEITVEPGRPALLELVSGAGQSAEPGETLAEPVVVRVLDEAGFPVPGLTVSWSASGDGTTSSSTTSTDAEGETGVAWTLGSEAGTQTLSASAGGLGLAVDAEAELIVASVVVTPETASFHAIGATQEFTAEARDADDNPIPGVSLSWTSEDEDIVTIDADGLATSTGTGSTTISASAEGVTGSASVSVVQTAMLVDVDPETGSVEPGETLQLSAIVRDSEGTVIPGAMVTWSSNDETLAAVDGSGLATGEAEGTVAIEATSDGVTGTMTLTVTAATPTTIEITDGDEQTASAGLTLDDALEVRVLSAFGRNVEGADVSWEPQNGGSATPSSSTSDGDGLTSASWTLGPDLGVQELRAAIDGDTVTFTATASGASRVFDRSTESDEIVIDDPDGDFNFPDSDWTLSMWVKPEDLGAGGFRTAFAGGGSPSGSGVYLYLNPDVGMQWHLNIRTDAAIGGLFASAAEGQWQHLVARRSGSTVTLWMDGVEASGSRELNEAVIRTGSPRIGRTLGISDSWFDGAISMVTRWSTALTDTEIAALADGVHPLDIESGNRDWYLALGSDSEVPLGGTFSASVLGTIVGGAPPVDPPSGSP